MQEKLATKQKLAPFVLHHLNFSFNYVQNTKLPLLVSINSLSTTQPVSLGRTPHTLTLLSVGKRSARALI